MYTCSLSPKSPSTFTVSFHCMDLEQKQQFLKGENVGGGGIVWGNFRCCSYSWVKQLINLKEKKKTLKHPYCITVWHSWQSTKKKKKIQPQWTLAMHWMVASSQHTSVHSSGAATASLHHCYVLPHLVCFNSSISSDTCHCFCWDTHVSGWFVLVSSEVFPPIYLVRRYCTPPVLNLTQSSVTVSQPRALSCWPFMVAPGKVCGCALGTAGTAFSRFST